VLKRTLARLAEPVCTLLGHTLGYGKTDPVLILSLKPNWTSLRIRRPVRRPESCASMRPTGGY